MNDHSQICFTSWANMSHHFGSLLYIQCQSHQTKAERLSKCVQMSFGFTAMS